MIRVQTPSRLHFGLFRVTALVGRDGRPGRRFGGVGLMVEKPGLRLTVHPDKDWSAEGPLAERALGFAHRFTDSFPGNTLPPHRMVIGQMPPEHVGLGTGTQLGLAVARALAVSMGRADLSILELADRVGRGARSALGIHGFERGGFLVEGGKRQAEEVAPLVAHLDFPEEWRLVLVSPAEQTGRSGPDERRAFEDLEQLGPTGEQTDALCRLTLLDMLPALVERDLAAFGEAVYEFNARVGQTFAPVQGGTYATPRVAELVAFLRGQGIQGAGQSSWGPTVFAILEDEIKARDLVTRLRRHFGFEDQEVILASASNRGATCTLW